MLLDPGIRDGKNPDPESGTNIPDHIFKSLVITFGLILKFFVADSDPVSGAFLKLHPGIGME